MITCCRESAWHSYFHLPGHPLECLVDSNQTGEPNLNKILVTRRRSQLPVTSSPRAGQIAVIYLTCVNIKYLYCSLSLLFFSFYVPYSYTYIYILHLLQLHTTTTTENKTICNHLQLLSVPALPPVPQLQ